MSRGNKCINGENARNLNIPAINRGPVLPICHKETVSCIAVLGFKDERLKC